MYRNKADIGTKQLYSRYLKSLDPVEKETGYALNRGVMTDAVSEVNKRIMQGMIDRNLIFRMPYGLGTLVILKTKPEVKMLPSGRLSLPIDFKATQDLWKREPELYKKKYVYHRNLHSGGYVAGFKWKKKGCADVRNIFGYLFEPVKDVKRELGRAMKDPMRKVDFFETF